MKIPETIVALSREQAEVYTAADDYILISIRCPNHEPARLSTDQHRIGLLELQFADTTEKTSNYSFKNQHADEVLHFVEKHVSKSTHIVVHCSAGVSRSRGVALALSRIYGWAEDEHISNGFANPLVVHTLLKRYEDLTGIKYSMPVLERLNVRCNNHPESKIQRDYDSEDNLLGGFCYTCQQYVVAKPEDVFAVWQ